jgi:F0F1-type ATP synthase membrane subunit a
MPTIISQNTTMSVFVVAFTIIFIVIVMWCEKKLLDVPQGALTR